MGRLPVGEAAVAKGDGCLAAAVLERTARRRERQRRVLGEGESMGEVEAATRLRSLFWGVPAGGVPKNSSFVELGEGA